jgi:hypothetical protein
MKGITTQKDVDEGAFHRIEMELLALNLDFESARSPALNQGLAALTEKVRQLARGGEGDSAG